VAVQRPGRTVYRALVGRTCHSRALSAQKTVVVTSEQDTMGQVQFVSGR
jgi:hypothetical protein